MSNNGSVIVDVRVTGGLGDALEMVGVEEW